MLNNNFNQPNDQILALKKQIKYARGKGLRVDKLKNEENFMQYLKLLYGFSKRYIVMISSYDTVAGPYFTNQVAEKLMKIGLKINLFNKFRQGYGAVIDTGELLFEALANDLKKTVEYRCKVDDVDLQICGTGFYVSGRGHCIKIDNVGYSPFKRGLNFVVYDPVSQAVLDAVNFDTYSESFPCHRPSRAKEYLSKYMKEHPGVSFLSLQYPGMAMDNLSANEQFITNHGVSRAMISSQPDNPNFAINKYIPSSSGVREVLHTPPSYHDIYGARRFNDIAGTYVNTVNGHRVTIGQPKEFKRVIYAIGGCRMFGTGVSDKGTIASCLQKVLNKYAPEEGIIVENYGFLLCELNGMQSNEEIKILNSLPVKSGDIVIVDFAHLESIPQVSCSGQRPHSYGEIFFDAQWHLTENGCRLVADQLFEKLKEVEFFPRAFQGDCNPSVNKDLKEMKEIYGLDSDHLYKLNEYKKILKNFYNSTFVPVVGAIVVNCNPFTLGHRYLIEQAASQCDHLIIFVVQEDQSFFSFDERIAMVDAGVADLHHVTVIPSGRFILSALTFTEYFNKSAIQEKSVDTSLDIELFAREIAPCLHIQIRFAGAEPVDRITAQYNQGMNMILPKYNVKFVEIPRCEIDGLPISASKVRHLLKSKDFAEIAKYVPKTTFDYLIEKYEGECDG